MISLPVTTDENNGVGWPTTCCAVGLLPLSCSGEQSKNVEMDDCAPRSNGLKRRGDDPQSVPSPKRRAVRSSNHGYYCAVPECSNRSTTVTPDGDDSGGSSLSFHRFPKDEHRRKAWVIAIRRDIGSNFSITSYTRVCSAHFKVDDFAMKTLYGTPTAVKHVAPTAVPTLFSWNQLIRREQVASSQSSCVEGDVTMSRRTHNDSRSDTWGEGLSSGDIGLPCDDPSRSL